MRTIAAPGSLLLGLRELAGSPQDAIRLRPEWPALLSCVRRVRRARWIVGDSAVAADWIEVPRVLRIAGPESGDALRVRFRFDAWRFAFARAAGRDRTFHALAADGSPIATLALDDVDAGVDELIWRLCDDAANQDQAFACATGHLGATRGFHPEPSGLGSPLEHEALAAALIGAARAGIPLRVAVSNLGATVTSAWEAPALLVERDGIRLRARRSAVGIALGRVRCGLVLAGATNAAIAIAIYGDEHATARVEPLEARHRDAWQRVLARVAR